MYMMCHVWIKYYPVLWLIADSKLPINLKYLSFPDYIFVYTCIFPLFWGEELTLDILKTY
jgi:hypothetical protein